MVSGLFHWSQWTSQPPGFSIAPDAVDLHDAGGLEQRFHVAQIVQRLALVEPPLDLRLLRHSGFGIADGRFDMSRWNDNDAIRVAHHQVTGIDGHAGRHDRYIDRARPAFAGIGYRD